METKFKNNLIQKLKEKDLSDSSIKMYVKNLEKLNDNMPLKNFSFLKDIDKISQLLDKYKLNTIRNYLISIVSCLGVFNDNKNIKKLQDKYYILIKDKKKDIDAIPSAKMSESQKDNWISWDQVEEKFNQLLDEVKSFDHNKVINEKQYNILLSCVILGLYFLQYVRRNKDYQMMYIIKEYNDKMPNDINYLCLYCQNFFFNVYKTSKKYGLQIIPINKELMNIIDVYIKYHPLIKGKKLSKKDIIPFLVNYKGKHLDKINSITRILNNTFDKKIGSSLLRHIYLTDKYGNIEKEREQTALNMGHTVQTQAEYIKDPHLS